MSNENKTKVCKHCQTEIPKKAKVCPQCRKKQGGIMKWVLLVLVAAGFLGALAGGEGEESVNDENKTDVAVESQQTVVETEVPVETVIEYTVVSVSEMVDTLEANAMKAEATYQDAYVEITGRLGNIDSDGKYFTLEPSDDEWAFYGVQCYMQNEEQKAQVIEMSVGDTVTLRGQITEIGEIMGYSLDIDSIN